MPTTSNFGWTTPADTDLVKDGASAIRTLGNGIDTSFLDLKGGTTDQVLAKNSNTDLDFKWVAQDDSNAIQNAIVDAKGDLITATAADTPARLAVGTNGQVLTADSTTATGLKWATSASGGMTQLATGTLSGNTISLTSISGSYVDLYLLFYGARSTAGGEIVLRINNDTNNVYNTQRSNAGSGTSLLANTNQAQIDSDSVIRTAADDNGFYYFPNYAQTNNYIYGHLAIMANSRTWGTIVYAAASGNGAAAITRLDLFLTGSDTFTQGTYVLYGVK